MKNFLITIMVTACILALCVWALSMATEYGPGPIRHQPSWPAGLAGVLNSHERVYGYWVGHSEDHIYYAGNATEFNAFIQRLYALEGAPITLAVHGRPGSAARLGGDHDSRFGFDWDVTVKRDRGNNHTDIAVGLWLGGNIKRAVGVPANVANLHSDGRAAL